MKMATPGVLDMDACSFSREGLRPHVKSPIIWGHYGTGIYPLCYLTKPKWMPTEEWEVFLDMFHFSLLKPAKAKEAEDGTTV
jgi:hypothetical protein